MIQIQPPDDNERDMSRLAGECGEVVEGMYWYILRNSPMHQPEIALFTALETIGIICGRIWETKMAKYNSIHGQLKKKISRTTTTDYLLILGPTGSGKEAVKTMIRDFLEKANLDIPTPPLATGINAVHTAAQKNPRVTFITDEAGLNRQTTGTGKGDPNGKKTVETYQMEIYASRTTTTNPQLYAEGKDNPNLKPIWRNALSVVLLSTPETYAQALGSDDAHSGYLSRYVILNVTRGRDPVLGEAILDDDDDDDDDEQDMIMIKPFLEWAKTHAGRPKYDTYAQLIPPSLAAAWQSLEGIASPLDTGETQAVEHAVYVRNPPKPKRGEMPPCPQHIRAGPDPVRWEPAARAELMQIYADNEAYCRDHPEAKELLTRKLQHVKIYAMRIALANDQVDRSCTMAMLELKNAKNSIDKANEALNEANGALSELTKKKKSSKKSVNAAKAAVDAALEVKQKAREIYIQKIEAVKDMFRMSYTDHPPVITAAHVKTANKFIDFTLKSSLEHIADAIPPQTWFDAKERIIKILRDQYKKTAGECRNRDLNGG